MSERHLKQQVHREGGWAAKVAPLTTPPMDCSTPEFPVLHCLPEFAQIHIIESVMLLTISSPATLFSFCFNLS